MKKNIEFDRLSAEKYGVKTRDGKKVHILCWDLWDGKCPRILAVVKEGNKEIPCRYFEGGFFNPDHSESNLDLMINQAHNLPRKKGSKYYYVTLSKGYPEIMEEYDRHKKNDNSRFESNNFFYEKEDAKDFENYLYRSISGYFFDKHK